MAYSISLRAPRRVHGRFGRLEVSVKILFILRLLYAIQKPTKMGLLCMKFNFGKDYAWEDHDTQQIP